MFQHNRDTLIKIPSTTPSNPLIDLYFNVADPKLSCTKRLDLAGLISPFGFQGNIQIKERGKKEISPPPTLPQVLKLLKISTRIGWRLQHSAIHTDVFWQPEHNKREEGAAVDEMGAHLHPGTHLCWAPNSTAHKTCPRIEACSAFHTHHQFLAKV